MANKFVKWLLIVVVAIVVIHWWRSRPVAVVAQ